MNVAWWKEAIAGLAQRCGGWVVVRLGERGVAARDPAAHACEAPAPEATFARAPLVCGIMVS